MIDINSLSYLIDDNLDDLINDTILFEVEDEVLNYFKLKSEYITFINSLISKKSKSGNYISNPTKDIVTNLPLEFIETNDCLTVNIIDDITRKILYQKNIYISKNIEVFSRIKYLNKLLLDFNYGKNKFLLKNKINNLALSINKTKILKEHDLISDEDYELRLSKFNSDEIIIKDDYANITNKVSGWIQELEVLNDIVKTKISNLDTYYKTYFSSDIYLKIQNSKNIMETIKSNNISDEFIANYNILNAVQYQRYPTRKSSIAFYTKKNEFVTLDEDINETNNIVRIKNLKNEINLVPNSELITFIGVFNKLKLNVNLDNVYYVDVNFINKKLTEKGYKPIYKEFNTNVKISNYENKKEYIKKDGVQYLNSVVQIESQSLIKEVNEKTIKVKNIDVASSLYNKDENTRFVLYKISSKYPGDATYELIKRDVKKSLKYEQLFNIPNWRKILMNSYIHKDNKTNTIFPIVIDGMKFASVDHYLYFLKYNNITEYDGPKLQQYNNHAKRFMLTYEYNSWGGDDVDSLVDKDNLGFKVRADWSDVCEKELIKILYAKFTQNPLISNALILTKDALITMLDNSEKDLLTCIELMRIRRMLNENITPEFYTNANDDRLLYYKIYDRITRPEAYIEVTEEPIKQTNLESLDGFYSLQIYDEDGNTDLIAVYMKDDNKQIFGLLDDKTYKIKYFQDMDMEDNKNIKLMENIELYTEDLNENDIRLEKINYLMDDKNSVYIEINNKNILLGKLEEVDGVEYIEFIN